MLSPKVEKALNEQCQKEFYSFYLYLAMAAYCHSKNFKGFAHWMKLQAAEEQEHAKKFYEYILSRDGTVDLKDIPAPTHNFASPADVFAKSLQHEKKITKDIHSLYTLALQEKDYATQIMLQWFVTEQVEEEANVSEIVEKLKMVPTSGGSMLYLDKELGKRGK